ncbi:endonuclease/exonuclease/phosphatase family protein [Hydrocarboniclastica marina]|uniref:Endonuclease n=1 Tax=Hydrocarboniclastica marina TaxID=2259620 RepID=A0A4P7XFW7_9ALTE|nr:endonuclease/exonuclease/phosphatase family protein [Hydrocarboniclastica marina]MAL98751.1 endonuclease [Alteromonadaceae bacterium]QCF24637.1 endonuclease [Hydrocarboniclastica marina]|tara:strand:- start:1782 stop:2867 length:1086 start_codon:yes stop_codon:yes gene_type:complete
MLFWILAGCTVLIALSTLASILTHEGWWVRVHDFPRLQLAAISALIALLAIGLLDRTSVPTWVLVIANALCMLYQGWWILPYTRLVPTEVHRAAPGSRDNAIRVLNTNVLTPNRRARQLLDIIQDNNPDIVVALETDRWWQTQLDALDADYPYSLKCPLDNLYGMLVYSRLPFTDQKIQYLVEDQVPSAHALVTLPSGAQVQFHALHPAPPSPTENEASTERDAELVIVGRAAAEARYPTIISGDLNDVAWSATTRLFRKVSGLLDPRVGRGMFNTFHASYPFIRWPLDHLFHSDHFTLVQMKRLPFFGSDHFPILVELALQPQYGKDQPQPETDQDDRRWASEKAAEEEVAKTDVHRPGE